MLERKHRQHYHLDKGQDGPAPACKQGAEQHEVVPGVPIVRSSTPRPLSFAAMMASSGDGQEGGGGAFPQSAPAAPPVPEELGEGEGSHGTVTAMPAKPAPSAQEFTWLFEYGLEMDPLILNSRERLDGLAYLYGPGVLKGYRLMLGAQRIYGGNGPTIVAIVPATEEPEAEVWGVLYRVPTRLVEQVGDEPSLLDTIHAAIKPQKFFQGVNVIVHDTQLGRELTSLTYVATKEAQQHLHLVKVEEWRGDTLFMRRLAAIAQKQKLPDEYIRRYPTGETVEPQHSQEAEEAPPFLLAHAQLDANLEQAALTGKQHPEQNTEPLPIVRETPSHAPNSYDTIEKAHNERQLIIFASYLVALLLVVLLFAILQGLGLGRGVLTDSFTPLGVPWLVMMYGLLGGCISSIVTLGRLRVHNPPLFVMVTWFTRPYIGALLAIFTYLVLTSGFFVFGEHVERHSSFFWLVGALAGCCESWIFFKRKIGIQRRMDGEDI